MSPPLPLSNHLPTSSAAVLVIFLVCSVLSSFRLIHNSMRPNLSRTANDVAQLSDQRFAALKNELPARAVVGYMGESNDSATPDYYLTQYSLAPLVVDRSTNHELIVANFPGRSLPQFPPALEVVKDFGNGVLLLTNKDAR